MIGERNRTEEENRSVRGERKNGKRREQERKG
jgi:hypothetical protein